MQCEVEQPVKVSDNEPEWMSNKHKCSKHVKLCILVR
jgi:hypothetical protein